MEALDACDRAIEWQPQSVQAWNCKRLILAKLYKRAGTFAKTENYGEVLAAYDRDIAENQGNLFAWIDRGFALCALARYEEALTSFERAIQLQPRSLEAWNNKGWALAKLRRNNEALIAFTRALEVDPHCGLSLDGKVSARASLDRDEKARRYERDLNYDALKALASLLMLFVLFGLPVVTWFVLDRITVELKPLPYGVSATCSKCGRPATRAAGFVVDDLNRTGVHIYQNTAAVYCDLHEPSGWTDMEIHGPLAASICFIEFICLVSALMKLFDRPDKKQKATT